MTTVQPRDDARAARKAKGAFYTPERVARMLVREAFGALDSREMPDDGRPRILDMACGDGAFLGPAFEHILESNDESSHPSTLLSRHIFGADLDGAALDMARSRLLEKAGGGARDELRENLIHGDAIIGPGFAPGAIDWSRAFPQVFQGDNPGFDIIIGNPPYIQLSAVANSRAGTGDRRSPEYKDHLVEQYGSAMGRANTFGYFMEKARRDLLRRGGVMAWLIPNSFLTQSAYGDLRERMLGCELVRVITFPGRVFADAVVEPAAVIARKREPAPSHRVRVSRMENTAGLRNLRELPQAYFARDENRVFFTRAAERDFTLREKIQRDCTPLGELCEINQAIALKGNRAESLFYEPGGPDFQRVLDGRDVARWSLNWSGAYLAYDRERIHSCKRRDIFETDEKILMRRVGGKIIAALDRGRFYALNTLVVITAKPGVSLKFILALLNSRLFAYYFRVFLRTEKKTFSEIQARQIARLPVKNLRSPVQAKLVAEIEDLVEQRLICPVGEAAVLEARLNARISSLYGLRRGVRA